MPLTRAWAPKLLQAAWPWETEQGSGLGFPPGKALGKKPQASPAMGISQVCDRMLGYPQPGESFAKGFHVCVGLAASTHLSSIQTPGQPGWRDTLQCASYEPDFGFADGSY